MKLQKVYSKEVQTALNQLEVIIKERKEAILEVWESKCPETQERLLVSSKRIWGKHPLTVWTSDDTIVRECKEEIKRICDVSVPVKYTVTEEEK